MSEQSAPALTRAHTVLGSPKSPRSSGRFEPPSPTRKGSGRRLSGSLPPCTSDTALETLEKRWQEAQQAQRPRLVDGGYHYHFLDGVRLPASRQVQALVDRRFLYLGREWHEPHAAEAP